MFAVGWAFAWDFWSRQRILLSLSLGYLLLLALLVSAFPADRLDPKIVGQLTIPLAGAVVVLAALFSYGEQADIAACESCYPRRSFTLPLRSVALAGWPLVIGAAVLALFWLVLAALILRPAGVPVPVLWPVVFLAALQAWLQALMWWSYPVPFLRILLIFLIPGGMAIGVSLGQVYEVSPTLLLAISGGLLPFGFLAAVAGVARARGGAATSWSWSIGIRATAATAHSQEPFASPRQALSWLEWQRNGWSFPGMVGLMIVPMLLLRYFGPAVQEPSHADFTLLALIILPPAMAVGAGAVLGNTHPWTRKSSLMPPFIAARPVTSAEMLAVKLRVAAWSTLITWGMVWLVLGITLPFSPTREVLARSLGRLFETQGAKGWGVIVLFIFGPPLLSWRMLVNQLSVVLCGRNWIIMPVSLILPVGVPILAVCAGELMEHPETYRKALLDVTPWVIAGALTLKLLGGMLVARTLLRRDLVAPRTVVRIAIAWVIAAGFLVGMALWLTPAEVYPPWAVGCGAVLFGLPLVRLSLAPLALDWNRHR
jgi:hypothetical protein